MGPTQDGQASEGFTSKLLPVLALKSQGEIKINGRPWQVLVDTRAKLYFKPHLLRALQMGSQESWQKPAEGEDLKSQLSWITVCGV